MNSSIRKLTKREILGSLSRYLAIFAIIALGAGFFVGLRLSRPDFLKTYELYMADTHFYDFCLVSTLGLTDDDVAAVKTLDGVERAEGAVGADFLFDLGDEENLIMMAQSITDDVNLIDLKSGRMPTAGNECLADPELYSADDIGKTIKLSDDNSQATFDTFKYDEYKIVGLTESVLYINTERGSSTLGSGTVKGYVYIPKDGFSTDYYTDIYVCVKTSGMAYSDEYKQSSGKYVDTLKAFMSQRAEIRRNNIIGDAEAQLSDARAQYESGKAEYDSGKAQYDSGYNEFISKKQQTEQQLNSAKAQLDEAESMMADPTSLDSKQAELDEARAKLDSGRAEYEQGMAQFEARRSAAYAAVQPQIDSLQSQISSRETSKSELEAQRSGLEGQLADAEANGRFITAATLRAQIATISGRISALNTEINGYNSRLSTLQSRKSAIDEQLEPYSLQLESAKAELDAGYAKLNDGQAQLDEARKMLANGGAELEAKRREYEAGKAQAEQSFAEAEAKLNSSKAQLDAAKAQLDDAAAQLDAAEKRIKNIDHADTYVLGRDTNIGYVSFESDTNVVQSVAAVFPLFFFLIAALVCLTTMTRMIGDQRTQIGIMKALGYSSGTIMGKYLFYSGSATLLGGVFGIGVGSIVFPAIVWFGYGLVYNFSHLHYMMDWGIAAAVIAANLAITLLVTWYCCLSELKCAPADLIRPKAPAAGKRIFLEKIPKLWKSLSFMQKVSARNIFRYKKRIFMMLIGIGGCTALVLTALGLNDTIQGCVKRQYDNIIKYDYELTLAYDMNEDERHLFLDAAGDSVDSSYFMYRGTADVTYEGSTKTVILSVTDGEGLNEFISLARHGTAVAYPGKNEAIINYNLARQLGGLKIGDKITITTSDKKPMTVRISGLFDNYVQNYVFISPDTCEEQLGFVPEYKFALINAPEGADKSACEDKISSIDGVRSVTATDDTRERMSNMMNGLVFVVAAIIVCAGLLAFIVLYNLTNINISERVREIATLKVLGFYPNESAMYVFRENMILTAMGAVFGLLLGVALHAFVMDQIKVDMMYFEPHISVWSYILALVLTFVFTVIVNLIMRRKIDNIDMAGALKSVE